MRYIVATLSLLFLLIPDLSFAQTVFYQGADREVARIEYAKRTGKILSEDSFVSIPNIVLPDDGDLWFVGAVTSRTCNSNDVPLTGNIDFWIEQAQEQLFELEMEAGSVFLQDLLQGIPCAKERLTTKQISDIFFLRGVLAAWQGETERPLEYFRSSIVLAGARPWNPVFPPSTKALFDRAQQEADAFGRITLFYDVADFPVRSFFMDGIDLSAQMPRGSIRTLSGEHVVQVVSHDGTLHTLVARVLRDGYLLSASGLQRVLAQPPVSGEIQLVQETYLGRRAEPSSVMVYEGEELKVFASYDRTSGGFKIEVGAPVEKFVRRTRVRYGAVGFSLSAGAAYYQTGYFTASMLGSFRMVRGFELELGGGIAMTRYGEVGFFLPIIAAGVRYLFAPEAVAKPFVAARVVVLLSPSGDWQSGSHAGPVGCGGVELLSSASKALALRAEACGGAAFAPAQPMLGFVEGRVGFVLRPIEQLE